MLATAGGPSTCTCDLLDGFQKIHADVELLTTDLSGNDSVLLGKERPWIRLVSCDSFTPLAFSRNFKNFLLNSDYDIYHCNTIWLYPSHITCKVARDKKKPYIVSPHGMLYPTALRVSSWKKLPIKKIWINKDIMKASCVHATCRQEMEYIRMYGYKGPIAIIPNPVVFPEIINSDNKILDRKIGYLGRLHPIKKVENLLYGAAEAIKNGVSDFHIDIMGRGSDDYETFLRKEVDRLGLNNIVEFIGFVSGNEKYERLSRLRALFVTSEQENFGMVIPEALICRTPVYASLGTPWEDLNNFNCGWWRDNDKDTISDVILEVMNMSDDELVKMGNRGRELIEDKYEQSKVALMMFNLYKWLLGEQVKPKFVYES